MADPCPTCGDVQRVYGVCRCPLYPEVDIMQLDEDGSFYTRHVARMTTEGLHSKSDIAAQLAARDREIDQLRARAAHLEKRMDVVLYAGPSTGLATSVFDRCVRLDRQIRTLRAKLMRERAAGLEALAMGLPDECYREGNVLHARARRLRAKADRIERGAP